MKRLLTSIVISTLALTTLFAAFVPIASTTPDSLFSSPALAIKTEKDIDIGWNTSMGSDFSALSFMSDPVKGMKKSATYIANKLANVNDISFWKNNPDLISLFSSIDPENFPTDMKNEDIFLLNVQTYFRTHFLSDEYGDINRAHAANQFITAHPEFFDFPESYTLLGGDLSIGTKLYGTHAKDGFAWQWDVSLGYGTSDSLLRGYGDLILEAGIDVAYAFNLLSPNLTLGISARPSITFDNLQLGTAFINARIEDSAMSIFTEPMRFGTGVKVNAGLLWDVNDALSFTLDFRNIPSFKSYFEWGLVDLAEGNLMPKRDRNLYYEAPDIALSSLFQSGPIDFKVEVSNVMNQLIWTRMIDTYDFDYYQILDLYLGYDINEDMTISTKLGKQKLSLGFRWRNLTTELTTKLDRGYLELKVGYTW